MRNLARHKNQEPEISRRLNDKRRAMIEGGAIGGVIDWRGHRVYPGGKPLRAADYQSVRVILPDYRLSY